MRSFAATHYTLNDYLRRQQTLFISYPLSVGTYYVIFFESRSLLGEILVSVKRMILYNVIASKNCHTALVYSSSNGHVVNRTSDNANFVQNLSSFVWLVSMCI